MRGVILVVLLLLVLALAACGGSTASDARAVETQVAARIFATQTASVLTPDATVPPRGTYKHEYEITESFDRPKNKTSVWLHRPPAVVRFGRVGPLLVGYTYEGTTPAMPEKVTFQLVYKSDFGKYRECHNLRLLLDGRIYMQPHIDVMPLDQNGSVTEYVISTLPVDEFLQIVNAQAVEAKLCNDEFTLDGEQMEALRDVASRMQP